MIAALRLAAHGEKADIAKPMKGLGAGIYEIAWLIAATPTGPCLRRAARRRSLGRKSKSGIKTPQQDIDLLRERIKRLKEQL